ISPGADGTGGYVSVDFTLAAPGAVTVTVGGATPLRLLAANLPAGENSFSWDVASLPDGRYQLVVAARPAGSTSTAIQSVPLVVDRTLTGYTVTPALVSPNGDGTADSATFGFTLAQAVPVQ